MRYIYLIFFFFSFLVYGDNHGIETSSGTTFGKEKNNVISWDDIPYASPPIGDLRWRAPKQLKLSVKNNLIKPKVNNFCVQ